MILFDSCWFVAVESSTLRFMFLVDALFGVFSSLRDKEGSMYKRFA